MGVRYVLEGSVRRAQDRVRITAQLIDAATETHLWVHRFDGELADIFAVQDEVTADVVGAIAPKLEQAEIERAKRKSTESLEAYDYYLRGKASFHQWTRESNDEALRSFYRAIEIDPGFAPTYGVAALCYAQRKMNGWVIDPQQEVAEAARLVERAVELGRDDAVALSSAGLARLRVAGDIATAAALVDQALALNPNLAQALYADSFVKNCQGKPEVALERLKQVVRLSPIDPLMYMMCTGSAMAHFLAGRYDEASSWAQRALRNKPNYYPALRAAAAIDALAGRLDQAKDAIARLRRLDPALRISHIHDIFPLQRAEDRAKYAEGLRMAGLPE
jgi:tetratricopeptide (TPR) repeat protein